MCTGAHPFIPAADTIYVANRCSYDGQQVENVFHVVATDGITATKVDLCANIVANWYHSEMLPLLVPAVIQIETFAQDVSTADGYETVNTGHINSPGTNAVPPLPNEVAFCLKLGTPAAGRSGHGRSYIYGLGTNQVVGNYVVSATASAFKAAYDGLVTDLSADGLALSIVSYCHLGAWRTEALVLPVTSISWTDLIVDAQRRRGPGRGR